MCGIFGISVNGSSRVSPRQLEAMTKRLFTLSSRRGKDTSGVALLTPERINVVKRNMPSNRLLKTDDYKQLIGALRNGENKEGNIRDATALIGHTRMATNGIAENHLNNQPIIKNEMVLIHNGIVVNHEKLWHELPLLERETDSDTEIIPALLWHYLQAGESLTNAVRNLYQKIEGVANIAVLFEKMDFLLLSTNNGSLYVAHSLEAQLFFFASERYMLQQFLKTFHGGAAYEVIHLEAGRSLLVNILDCSIFDFPLVGPDSKMEAPRFHGGVRKIQDISFSSRKVEKERVPSVLDETRLANLLEENTERIDHLKRCTRCLIPETFPFIAFDNDGVCSICNQSLKIDYLGSDALEQLLGPFRKGGREPDIIIPLSGGRDSTYTLHYVKTEMGMNPVAYTYDWGMVTDLARRNISRITAKLGIEHILISADINKKREFIRKNVNAWLKRPRLGVLPLFMAGDKQFFYYANLLQKQMGIDNVLFGMNPLERTDFKVGFTGIREEKKQDRHYYLSNLHKLRIGLYYGKEYVLNPSYINSSLLDTLGAFLSYYFISHDYHIFFEYIPWREDTINRTLIEEYNWETSPDTATTWRIGDGTASFYNYIYYTVAGFSEIDTFRSNQIRQGIITREEAQKAAREENRPRYESIKWYCDTIGIDYENAIRTINRIPKIHPLDVH